METRIRSVKVVLRFLKWSMAVKIVVTEDFRTSLTWPIASLRSKRIIHLCLLTVFVRPFDDKDDLSMSRWNRVIRDECLSRMVDPYAVVEIARDIQVSRRREIFSNQDEEIPFGRINEEP